MNVTTQRSFKYYDLIMAACVCVLLCANLIGPAKAAQVDLPLIGTVLKRPLLVGLAIVIVWEPLTMALPGYLKLYTVAYYLQGLVPHAMPANTTMSMLQTFFQESPGFLRAIVTLAAIGIGCLWLGTRAIERKEYVLEQ